MLVLSLAGTVQAKDPSLLSLSMEHFRDSASVVPADGMETVSTENGFREHHGPMRSVWNDVYLKAIIDTKSDQKSFQVIVWITYVGNLRSYKTATYQTATGVHSVPTTPMETLNQYCSVGDCTYTERVSFPIDEASLRKLATEQSTNKPQLWPFQLIAKSGPKYSGVVSTAEIGGLLAKVDGPREPIPVAAAAASASLNHDLGIGGIPVAGTADMPNRAGVLITSVAAGSVAQKSGIIVGDIISDFDDRPIKTPEELQAAVAASASNLTVSIKLYRGTTAMKVIGRL